LSAKNPNKMVMLELSRRNEIGSDSTTNRIPLHIESITINTNKTVPNVPIPFTGAIKGESTNIAFDMGLASKTIDLQGVLTEQTITKQSSSTGSVKQVVMTSFEIAQLIHSYADSSSLQRDQNINKILFFYPSKVDNEFEQRTVKKDNTTVTKEVMETLDISEVPIIPFTFKNRAYDNSFAFGTGNTMDSPSTVFDVQDKEGNRIDISNNHTGVSGFIRSFTTSIIASEFPSIGFSLNFEEATVIGDNFFD
jgi:hypothetical protein